LAYLSGYNEKVALDLFQRELRTFE